MEPNLIQSVPVQLDRRTRRKMLRDARKRDLKQKQKTQKTAAAAGLELARDVPGHPAPVPGASESPLVSDHARRQQARVAGILVPPTASERSGLRDAGHAAPEPQIRPSGLWTPPT